MGRKRSKNANGVADELPFTASDVVDYETGVEPRFDEKLGSTPIPLFLSGAVDVPW